jgi:K+-sensing histidine kinase KdpD
MPLEKLPTQFAPAERESMQIVHRQNQYMAEIAYVQQILDAIPDLLLILNDKRQAVFCNQALMDFLGKNLDQVLGYRPGEIFSCVHAQKSKGGCGTTEFCRVCNAVRAFLSSQQGRKEVSECRLSANSAQGGVESFDLRVWASPFDCEQERFCIFVLKDISHEKRRRVLERLFFHDILNAAGSIQGFVDLLKTTGPEEAPEMVETVSSFIKSMVDEIEAQKELAAAENNELIIRKSILNSEELVDNIIQLYCNHEVARRNYILKDSQFQEVNFESDQRLISRVLGNMLKNALEASPANSSITVGCARHEDGLEFWVHNQSYIPRNVQLQIFQRSFSTKDSARGLGTYSIRMFTESYLQGRVRFYSSKEEGTTFYAKYPFSLSEEQDLQEE